MTLIQAIQAAREAATLLTGLPIDQVVQSARQEEGWRILLDVRESKARMGDNDLLATYEVLLDGAGELAGFNRIARYHRQAGAVGGDASAAA